MNKMVTTTNKKSTRLAARATLVALTGVSLIFLSCQSPSPNPYGNKYGNAYGNGYAGAALPGVAAGFGSSTSGLEAERISQPGIGTYNPATGQFSNGSGNVPSGANGYSQSANYDYNGASLYADNTCRICTGYAGNGGASQFGGYDYFQVDGQPTRTRGNGYGSRMYPSGHPYDGYVVAHEPYVDTDGRPLYNPDHPDYSDAYLDDPDFQAYSQVMEARSTYRSGNFQGGFGLLSGILGGGGSHVASEEYQSLARGQAASATEILAFYDRTNGQDLEHGRDRKAEWRWDYMQNDLEEINRSFTQIGEGLIYAPTHLALHTAKNILKPLEQTLENLAYGSAGFGGGRSQYQSAFGHLQPPPCCPGTRP